MFANGGGAEANPYYYVNNQNKLVPLDPTKLFNVLETAPIPEIEALIQNPDVRYSPETQEIFRQIVGKRKAGFSSVSPSTFEFGEALPDYLSFYSGVQDAGGVALDTLGEIAERGKGLFTGFMADQGEPQDTFVSERYPFNRPGQPYVSPQRPTQKGLAGAVEAIAAAGKGIESRLSSLPPLGPSEEGILRRGYTNPELAAILNRAQSGEVQDFEAEIEQLTQPDVVDTASVEEVNVETPRELPTGTVEIRNISPEDYEGSNIALLKQEMEIMGRDEEGNPLPETRLLRDPEIQDLLDEIKPIELKVDVDKTEADSLLDVEEKFDGLPDSEVQELLDPIKPILSIPEAAAEAEKAQEEQDDDQPPPARDVITRKLEEPGFFGSDRFLDFIRNVGGELTRTGQFGTGLSLGASKAAEERAARELMAEQEERDFASKLRLARAEAALEAAGEGSYDKDKIKTYVEFETNLTGALKNFDEDERIVSDLNQILNEDINDPNAFGARGFITKISEDLAAAAGMGAKEWSELAPAKRIQTILDVTAQRSVRNILGESGKTISNLDRELVANIFGSVNIFTSPAELKKKLQDSRAQIIQGMRNGQDTITSNATALQEAGYPSRVLQNNIPLLQRILKFNFDDIENYKLGSNATGYIETTL